MNKRLSEHPNSHGRSHLGVVILYGAAAAMLVSGGCTESSSSPAPRQNATSLDQKLTGEVLFDTVARTLGDLPQNVNLEVRPPVVVLDATNSRDRKTVMAIVANDPRNPVAAGLYNYLEVVTRNSRFESLRVQPGDRVRYFSQTDRFGKIFYIETEVFQVVNDNALLLTSAFQEPNFRPYRLEIWRYSDEKLKDIERRFSFYMRGRGELIGWEPSPDETVLNQVIDRLNQWIRRAKPQGEWRLDPLLETLSDDLRKLAPEASLAASIFQREDHRYLQEAVWLRDISNWARGDSLDPLERASRLFDWTVRNIQLETSESLGPVAHHPWHTLMYGRGTAEQRAWVFTLLCRQQGLEVVMLATPDAESPASLRPALAALWNEGKFYLFDLQLGLPIPGPGSPGGKPSGVATLAQVLADDSLLRRLDLDAEHPYRLQADDLRQAVALIEATPLALSKRMKLVEERLAGDNRIVLSVDATALAESVRGSERIGEVRLWDLPYRTLAAALAANDESREAAVAELRIFLWRPRLWKARVLHFQGKFEGDESAKTFYRAARPSEAKIEKAHIHPEEKQLVRSAKKYASYWLGLLLFEEGNYRVATEFLDRHTLQATPEGPWTLGARYNLARAQEAQGAIDEAIALYEVDTSPQSHGNRLRARWLRGQ